MKKLTRFAARDAEAIIAAIPFKSETAQLSGRTLAAIALTMVSLRGINEQFSSVITSIAEKVKPEGYDEKATAREKAFREAFPDGTPFDAEKWAELCPDKDFESVYNKINEDFQAAVAEAGHEEVEVDIRLTAEHLEDVACVVAGMESIPVNGEPVAVQGFLYMLARLVA